MGKTSKQNHRNLYTHQDIKPQDHNRYLPPVVVGTMQWQGLHCPRQFWPKKGTKWWGRSGIGGEVTRARWGSGCVVPEMTGEVAGIQDSRKKKKTWGSWVSLERKTNMTMAIHCSMQVGEDHEKLKSDKHFLIKITSSCWMANTTLTQNQAIQSKESCWIFL